VGLMSDRQMGWSAAVEGQLEALNPGSSISRSDNNSRGTAPLGIPRHSLCCFIVTRAFLI
jgi:hypothetical protein